MPSQIAKSFTILRGLVYSAAVRPFDARLAVALPPWLRPVGFVIAAAGALLAGLCIATFVTRGRGTPAPFDPPRDFVASGPYRYVRNPMYVGGAAVILGAGLIVASLAIVLLAFGFLGIMHLFVVLSEEPTLTARFGASYERYRASVHRWLIRKPARPL
jgi:protein-S-isoprenylcysteine O-methyltransferase Ste14